LPASSVASDKARIFNENIQELYSGMGSSDDLDRIIGTAQLDTVYLAVTDQFNLYDHYKIAGSDNFRIKAAKKLKKYSRVIKSDYGELKVKVWDTDKDLAPQLANAITEKLESIHRDLQSAGNKASLQSLVVVQQKIGKMLDSINPLIKDPGNEYDKNVMLRKTWMHQFQENENLAGQYQLVIDNKPPVLMIVEKAKPAIRRDRPRYIRVLIATVFLSLFFGLLVAVLLERRKTNPL